MDESGDNIAREGERTLGTALAAERERQGLSRVEVAQRLHMSPMQIEALERGDYAHLPKGTFLRGFVRNYAKVLGVAPDPLLELLAGTTPREPSPGIVVPTQNIRFDPLGERLSSPYVKAGTLAVVAIAVAFAAMYWAMYVRPKPPGSAIKRAPVESPVPVASPAAPAVPAPSQAGTTPPPAPAVTSNTPSAASSTASDVAPLSSPATAPGKSAATDAATKAAAPEKAAGPVKRIQLHFEGESWVEIRDSRGKILFQRLNPAGADAELAARPPLQVVIGNAPEVEMTYDGRPFDLDAHTTVAVARFTLE